MKTIISNETNHSLYIFKDDEVMDVDGNRYEVGDPVELIILDCNSNNTTVHENVTPPSDWIGRKYIFDGTDWTVDSDYVDSDNVEEIESDFSPSVRGQ
tara:strand:- start:226 stop:519 length:294 start_codon:yes stop_codon:yes gene_type:complete